MKGKLNLFQATMLRWRDLHPYNAVHVVRVEGPLDSARLERDIDAVLAAHGLTGFALDAARRRFEYTGGVPHAVLRIVTGGSEPAGALETEVERELNAPFPREGRFDPFRFFALPSGASFHLGLAYDHVIAGGDSIVRLLKCIVDRHAGEPGTMAAQTLDLYPPTYGRLFLRNAVAILRGLPAIRTMAASCRRSLRPRYPRGTDPHNGFASFRVDVAGHAALAGVAKAWGVTRNDLLMATLLEAQAPVAGEARHAERRRELSVASIVDIHRDFALAATATFGPFLASFRISHPVPIGIPLRQLALDIHTETARIRQEKLYLQTLLGIAGSGVMWRFLSPERRSRLHAKSYPVSVGISPLDVDRLWSEGGAATSAPEYLRASPTGPLAPLVVAVTTAEKALLLGFSYRTAAYTRADIARMGADIVHRIANLHA